MVPKNNKFKKYKWGWRHKVWETKRQLTKILAKIKPLGVCPYCGAWFVYPKRRRLNTQYHNNESNWQTSCLDCYDLTLEYYSELWQDYYDGCM